MALAGMLPSRRRWPTAGPASGAGVEASGCRPARRATTPEPPRAPGKPAWRKIVSVSVTDYEIAVIGGGAAGLATAIFTRRLNPARSVAVLDGAKKLGAKILVSGGGRCNVTNSVVTEQDFWGGKPTIVRNILRAFAVPETVAFFEEIGISLHEEHDGKLFPDANRARDVLDALLWEAGRVGVAVLTDHRVHGVLPENNRFTLVTATGRSRPNDW